jgi:RimJ/RimL family protein N-acetyltransferase
MRPIRVTDEEELQRFFYRLSNESIHRRFLAYKRTHPHEEIQKLVDVEFDQSAALVVQEPDGNEVVGVCRYDVDPATRTAEIAFVVRDDWQGRGLGTLLLQRMAEIGRARGLTAFRADVQAMNKPMLMVFYRSGLKVEGQLEGDMYALTLLLGQNVA